jgi:CRP-like cAMP-binding protein
MIPLPKVPVLKGIAPEVLVEMAKEIVSRSYKPGDIVVREGTANNLMFIIETGRVEVIKGLGTDNEKLVATIGELEIFGEMSLLESAPRSASIRVREPASIHALSAATLLRVARKHPDAYSKLMFNLAKDLSKRLRQTVEKAGGFAD